MEYLHKLTFRNWIFAWVNLFESLVKIITLALWLPNWSFDYLIWEVKRDIKKGKGQIK